MKYVKLTENSTILFEGVEYPVREIYNGAWVSTLALNDALQPFLYDEMVQYEEAEYIDNSISGYVDEKEIKLNDAELEKLCKQLHIIE